MPLPARWETRSEFIRHYGQVDAFAFDWYCVALSQVRRASRLDVADRRLPVRQGFVDITELDALYRDVFYNIGNPLYDRLFPNLSQQQFSLNYQTIRQHLQEELPAWTRL